MRPVLLFTVAALAAFSSAAKTTVLGRLGRARSAAQIYSAPSAKAKVMGRVTVGRYLVVRPAGANWTTVVLDNRRLAYIPAQAVETLAYEVTEDGTKAVRPPMRRPGSTYLASRGSYLPRVEGTARDQMAEYATTWQGTTPYKWGGTELGSGIDCSGFVKKMYGAIGLNLPRTAAEQAQVGTPILNYQDLQKGDRLYFWDAKRGKIGHTGIYIGGGRFVHSSSGHKGIATDVLSARWQKICVAARR